MSDRSSGDDSLPQARWVALCIDVADDRRSARFYAELLGWAVTASDGQGWSQLRDPSGGPGLNIQVEPGYERPVWPDPAGAQQKMMHFEVEVADLEVGVRSVIAAGGTEAAQQPADRDRSRIRIMLDPDGHPFCLFVQGE